MGSHASASEIEGPISRHEVLSRVQDWVRRGITYTQTGPWVSDLDGDGTYRRDCSGLVSMAWHLNTSYVTGDFEGANSRWCTLGSRDDWQPGDAMVRPGHMELFAFWADRNDHGKGAYVYSFNRDGETVRNPYARSNLGELGFNTAGDLSSFKPIRRTGLVAYPSAPPTPTDASRSSSSAATARSTARGGPPPAAPGRPGPTSAEGGAVAGAPAAPATPPRTDRLAGSAPPAGPARGP
ncbi:hypothetical protein ACQPWW_27075 [Micromonospora sp. CA-240977]|uniref:hypothetical protein n=1 Tax=Micromonospora sp. CA-240977 TaxID=3239957 RepID=UPI003D90CB48